MSKFEKYFCIVALIILACVFGIIKYNSIEKSRELEKEKLSLSKNEIAYLTNYLIYTYSSMKNGDVNNDVIATSAVGMQNIYNKNAVEGNHKFLNQYVLISGKISYIGYDSRGQPYVALATDKSLSALLSISLYFHGDQTNLIASLSKEQDVRFICTGGPTSGIFIKTPVEYDCRTIENFTKDRVTAFLAKISNPKVITDNDKKAVKALGYITELTNDFKICSTSDIKCVMKLEKSLTSSPP